MFLRLLLFIYSFDFPLDYSLNSGLPSHNDFGLILNPSTVPVDTGGPGGSGGGPGGSGGGSGGSSTIDTRPRSDTTKLADHLVQFRGQQIYKADEVYNYISDPNYIPNHARIPKILCYVKQEHPGFFFRRPNYTIIDNRLISYIRALNENYP